MTNPNDAVGTNAAYGSRTSVNAFNDFAQLVNGRGILSGWAVSPKSGMVLNVGGVAGTRDVAVAEDNLGNRTTVDNRSGSPIEVELEAASASSNRYDAIVVYVNNPAQADDTTPDAPSVCGIIAVQGGTTGVSEQQIRAAISADGGTGSVAYYAVLATIFIGAGTSAITSANITQEHTVVPDDMVDLPEYSSSEKAVGRWLNGEIVYRKTIDVGNLPNASVKQVNHGISFDKVIKVEGIAQDQTGIATPLPFPGTSGNPAGYIQVAITSSAISIGTGVDRSNNTGYITIYYTKSA